MSKTDSKPYPLRLMKQTFYHHSDDFLKKARETFNQDVKEEENYNCMGSGRGKGRKGT